MLLCCVLRVDRDENVKNNANCLKAEKRCIGMMELAIKSNANLKLCTDPQMLDQKSNDWRSIFLWLNIVLNLKRK